MNNSSLEDQFSDDEIFTGPLTLKEIKKRLIPRYRQTIGYCVNTDPKDDTNSSLKLIETHSAPDVSPKGDLHSLNITKSESSPDLSPTNSSLKLIETHFAPDVSPKGDLRSLNITKSESPDVAVSEWDDDSLLRLEQTVSDMCMSTDKPHDESKSGTNKYFITTKNIVDNNEIKVTNDNVNNQVLEEPGTSMTEDEHNFAFKTPTKNNYLKCMLNTQEEFKTPSSELKITTPLNKIPGNPISYKKQLPTPRRYLNVASPVAAYIRNSPQVPLMKNVCPKRPLPGVSSIPKPPKPNVGNKENFKQENVKVEKLDKQGDIKLPALAYRNAKETKVIDIPEVENMPQNHWAKKVASSIPKAMVAKHTNRETSSAKKPLQGRQEDSFVGLPLHQADLSVCTQKSSYAKPKKNI